MQDGVSTKVDLHVHSSFSRRPTQWILQKLGCPESFTEPREVYRITKKRGMSLVTITDHDSINGCLEIAHLPGTFISEEVTTYFPEDGCKIHVLAYNIDEAGHRDIQKARANIFDLVDYLQREGIHHAVAHPLFSINDRLTLEHLEKLLLLFKNCELNGGRDSYQNECLEMVLSQLDEEFVLRLAEKHHIEPPFPEPWVKNLTGGSDDHSSLNIAKTYTQVPGLHDPASFLEALAGHEAVVRGRASTPLTLAHNLYGIAYQYYRHKSRLGPFVKREVFVRFLDRFLQAKEEDEESLISRLRHIWSTRKRSRRKKGSHKTTKTMQELLRWETQKLIRDDAELRRIIEDSDLDHRGMENRWFEFVNQVSNKTLYQFADNFFNRASGANVFEIFQSIGAAGGLYALMAPYFVSFSLFSKGRHFAHQTLDRFVKDEGLEDPSQAVRVAHFTDTFYEVNGVALTLQQQVQTAIKTGRNLKIITCGADETSPRAGVRNFKPIGVYELPEYPEQKLLYPPFLEMLNYCYNQGFTHIHSATPGPMGIAALIIARILKLPMFGTYHTALPQYARYLTNDWAIEGLVWKYTLWYYDQMDVIFTPSRSTAEELIGKGISARKVKLFPNGIDVKAFHPAKRNGFLRERYGVAKDAIKLLYVGRISKEKNLPLLADVYRSLIESTEQKVHLVLVGDGPYLSELREVLEGLPCTFTGYLQGEELSNTFASCDLFVFPSTTDTFGNVVLEAQASGLPVLVTDMGGPQENLIPGETGLIVHGNDGEAFLQGLKWLLSDSQRLRRMSGAARRYMEGHSLESTFAEGWRVYEETPSHPLSSPNAMGSWPSIQR